MAIAFRTYVKNGSTYGAIVENFRDPATGKGRTTSIRSYGNLDRLKEVDPDFMKGVEAELNRLKQDAKHRNQVDCARSLSMVSGTHTNDATYCPLIKFGEVILRRCWEELELHRLFWRLTTEMNTSYDIDAATYCLTAARLVSPGSKKKCFESSKMSLFNYSSLKLDNMYSVLDVLSKKKNRIINFINAHAAGLSQRDLTVALYDVTTFYFESFDEDTVRAHGMSKEHRTAEKQVVLGLLIDTDGIPIDYELFRGNTHDMGTMLQVIDGYLKRFGNSGITIVADAGLNCKQNLLALQEQGMKFIVAQSMRKLPRTYLERALGGGMSDWDFEPNGFDHWRSRELLFPIECDKVDESGHKTKVTLDTRLIVNFSEARFKKDMADIDKLEAKARKMLAQGDSAIESGKSRRYAMIAKFRVDENGQSTGNPVNKGDVKYTYGLNTKLIEERKRVAGYYAFITNDAELSKMEQYHRLRSLWRIEQCFRIMKTFLEARPIYVRTEEHIRGHFVLCYIALVIERLCLRKLKEGYDPNFSTDQLVAFLNGPAFNKLANVNCSTQLLCKCVGGPYNVGNRTELETLSAQLDKIFACFGVDKLHQYETVQSVHQKLGVSLRLNEFLTSKD